MTKEEIIRNYGSLSLAYIGDAAYELTAREYLLNNGVTDNGKMHVKTKTFVSAHAQNTFLPGHNSVSYRGRARGGPPRAKRQVPLTSQNADLCEYHGATGFEALWGYLYLSDDRERMANLFEIIVNTNFKTE